MECEVSFQCVVVVWDVGEAMSGVKLVMHRVKQNPQNNEEGGKLRKHDFHAAGRQSQAGGVWPGEPHPFT